MALEGTVVNGMVVCDAGTKLPEGARVRLEVIDDDSFMDDCPDMVDPSLPDDHPCAPYNREKEIAILRASIDAMKAGEKGIPFRQAMEELSRKHNLPPLPPE